jgi:signal peptidase I
MEDRNLSDANPQNAAETESADTQENLAVQEAADTTADAPRAAVVGAAVAVEAVGDGEDEGEDEKDEARMELYDWMQCIVLAIICGIFLFVFVGRTIGVQGDSMYRTLHWHDRVIMSGLFYTPKNGDIVIFQSPSETFGGTPLVKRVIAVAGQTIDIDFYTGEVSVDGVVLDEPYISEPTHLRSNFSGPVTVPDGHVFVLGDNRNHSSDSRDDRVGFVDTRYILGKVLFLVIPGGDTHSQRDWSRFGMVYN